MDTTMNLEAILSYYRQPGKLSDPGKYATQLATLPGSVPELVKTLQGLVLHIFWAERYGVSLSEERKGEVSIRGVQKKMARMLEIDNRPLTEARPNHLKLVGNCRDFALMLASMLETKGIAARARCGFGTYFMPGHYEEHWMTEYWKEDEQRWVQVDSQLDETQQKVLGIDFDPLDMPYRKFVLAGDAWQMCREGKANPDNFGIFEYHGWDFVRGNGMRDLLSLNKIETLPWDFWGMMQTPVAESTAEQMALVDRAAELTLGGNEVFQQVRDLVEDNPCFQVNLAIFLLHTAEFRR